MRIFAAVVPPEEALDDLAEFLEPRRAAGPDLRWTDPTLWHVTLAFMADVPERTLEAAVQRMAEAVVNRTPVPLLCKGGGAFPNPYEARVTWIGVDGSKDALGSLAALSRGVRLACSRAGASPEGGPFHPHLTVARSRRPFEATRWLRVLDGYAGPPWLADEVTVFASHHGAGKGAPRYEPTAVLELTGLAG
jgi:RNA 2',3'-cyclic 3'-phosphodiesterase